MSEYSIRANSILDKALDINSNISSLKGNIDNHILKLKEIRTLFSNKFSALLLEIESIPEDKVQHVDDVSPASITSTIFWEWLYTSNSTKIFEKNNEDHYAVNRSSGTINAYSSHETNTSYKWILKFHNTTSFGCGGYGIVSKNDPQFETGFFGNYGGHPLICLCCNGSWSGVRMNIKGSQALQYSLKSSQEKILTFEVNYEDNKFYIYDSYDRIHAEYDLSSLSYNTDLVLCYYSTSFTDNSHEIIPE